MKRPGGFDGDEPGVQDEVRTDRELRAPIPLPTWRLSRKTAATADVDPDERSEAAAEGPAEASGEVSVETPADAQVPAVPVVAKSSVDLAGQDQDDDPVRSAQQELKRARRSVRRRERKEQRRFTAHLRRRRRVWLVAGGAVVALALFVVVGAFSPLMAVREVQIVGASQVNVDELQGALARFDGTPLALVDEREVHRALEPFPLIQRYSVERIPPHTLVVRIEERDAVIAVDRGGTFDLLDPAGVLVGTVEARPVGVPLAGGQAAVPSSPVFTAAGRVIRDLPQDLREQLAEVSATSAQDVGFVLTGGTRVVWGDATDTQRKALVLRSMLAAVGAVSMIDVSSPNAPVFQ